MTSSSCDVRQNLDLSKTRVSEVLLPQKKEKEKVRPSKRKALLIGLQSKESDGLNETIVEANQGDLILDDTLNR